MRAKEKWLEQVQGDPIPWLLEPDNPSARYRTLVELLDRPPDDAEALAAQQAILAMRPVRRILDAQWPAGYWMHPDVGYSPKHKATVWQVIFLAQLGLPRCEPVERAVEVVLAHSRLSGGTVPGTDVPEARFSALKDASGAILCLNGNLLRALSRFGYGDAPRVQATRAAMVAQIHRDEFRCRANGRTPSGRRPARMGDGLPCAWGAIKALGALLTVPPQRRRPAEQAAIELGVRFLLSHDLTQADYPTTGETSPLWFQFAFPLGYPVDLLELLDVLLTAGVAADRRVQPALELVLSQQDEQGCWALEHTPRNMWASFGRRGQPNKWVTLRALSVLKKAGGHGE
ncbi:MAG: hypothetical protein H8D78_01610 [Chloroflexi bacterium]|nr:hypothetical protein [Chloroflexota bacterium]